MLSPHSFIFYIVFVYIVANYFLSMSQYVDKMYDTYNLYALIIQCCIIVLHFNTVEAR